MIVKREKRHQPKYSYFSNEEIFIRFTDESKLGFGCLALFTIKKGDVINIFNKKYLIVWAKKVIDDLYLFGAMECFSYNED